MFVGSPFTPGVDLAVVAPFVDLLDILDLFLEAALYRGRSMKYPVAKTVIPKRDMKTIAMIIHKSSWDSVAVSSGSGRSGTFSVVV